MRAVTDGTTHFEIGCRAHFLQLLCHLARHVRNADFVRSKMILHKERTAKLAPVLEFVERNDAQLITLKEAACLAKMSVPKFVSGIILGVIRSEKYLDGGKEITRHYQNQSTSNCKGEEGPRFTYKLCQP